MKRNIETILADMAAVVESAESRSMTDDEVTRYEGLEAELATARKDAEIRSRQQAYTTPVRTDLHVGVATSQTDDTEERAFVHYLRTGQAVSDLTRVETRSQSEGTGSEGGYMVPEGFRQRITERLKG